VRAWLREFWDAFCFAFTAFKQAEFWAGFVATLVVTIIGLLVLASILSMAGALT
jgi:hypothetical protein